MKKILGLTIVATLIMSMVAGGVWAYFSDFQTSSNNVLAAGTLDLTSTAGGSGPSGKVTVTTGGNGLNGYVVFQKLLPNDSGNITWTLTDLGSIPGTLSLSSAVSFALGTSNEIKTAAGDTGGDSNGYLDEYLGVTLQRGVGADQTSALNNLTYLLGNATTYVAASNLQSALNSAGAAMDASGGNDTVVYVLNWQIGTLFGSVNPDIVEGDSAQINITFTLNQ